MVVINHKDFEKVALNLWRLSKNIDAESVARIADDNGEPFVENVKDVIVDSIKDKFTDKIEDSYDSGVVAVYQQPKLRSKLLDRFKFKKVAVNLFPRELRPVLENIGLASNEQRILSGQIKHMTKHKFEHAIGAEEDDADRKYVAFANPKKRRAGFI